MTVAELISLLQALPPEAQSLPVLCDGYEGGLSDISPPRQAAIWRDVNLAWYYGPHEEVNDYGNGKPTPCPAIVLDRASNPLS